MRRANSVAVISEVSVQPRMATRPSRASNATTTRSLPKRRHNSSTRFGIGDSGGADHDSGGAGVEQAGRRIHAADAAAHLDGYVQPPRDGGDGGQVGRIAGVGAVQINDVETLPALDLPTFGNRQGVVGKDRFLLVVALVEPDAVAAAQVDCRYDFHSSNRLSLPAVG